MSVKSVIKCQILEYREGNFKFCCKFHVKKKRVKKKNATGYSSSPGLRLAEYQQLSPDGYRNDNLFFFIMLFLHYCLSLSNYNIQLIII